MIYRSFTILLASSLFLACGSEEGGSAGSGSDVSTDDIANPTAPSQQSGSRKETAEITFDNPLHDFGASEEGEILTHEFWFTNTGGSRLIVTNVKPTCGCTIPYFPKEPIAPGKRGSVKVELNTEKTGLGHHEKSVTVYSNSNPNKMKLTFSTEVRAKAAQ
jgi:hypothetical protein